MIHFGLIPRVSMDIYNPLTRIKKVSDIEDAYNGRSCPICGRSIRIDLSLMSKEVYEI